MISMEELTENYGINIGEIGEADIDLCRKHIANYDQCRARVRIQKWIQFSAYLGTVPDQGFIDASVAKIGSEITETNGVIADMYIAPKLNEVAIYLTNPETGEINEYFFSESEVKATIQVLAPLAWADGQSLRDWWKVLYEKHKARHENYKREEFYDAR